MRRSLIGLLVSASLLAWPPGAALAQSALDAAAEAYAAELANARGDSIAAESAYSRILAVRPTDIGALVGRGNARAFQKKYTEAEADFNAALAQQSDHVGALVGLGHALAWSGRHADAMARFERALAVAPDNIDAQRGAAFTELWRGNAAGARARFERLLAQVPQDRGAREGLEQARAALAGRGPRYEVSAWFGRTQLPGGLGDTGLRFAELAVWPYEQLRLFARYDDGLSRDNAALVRSERSAALKSIGGYLRWHERYGTLLEFGRRNFPDGADQQVYRIEQSFYLDGGYEAKVGGWHGPRSDDRTEWLAYAGVGIPLADNWRFEPTYFYSRNGLPGGTEWRLLLATNYDFRNGWEVGAGVAGGRAHADGIDRDVRDGFLRASYQPLPWLRLQLLTRRETVKGGDAITVLSLGTMLNWR